MQIALDDILIEDRLRDLQQQNVPTIAESFKALGQSVPILVYREGKGFRLIDGQHRIAAARSLGWREIAADVKDFSELDEREIEFERKMIEIDTTLARADTTKGIATDLLERRVRVVVEKNAYSEKKAAEKEAEEANRRRAAALAKEKAAEDAKEKKRAALELEKAEQARVNATKRVKTAAARCSEVSESLQNNGTLPANLPGVGKARQEVAAATNVKVATIEKDSQWFNELGRDFVKMIVGTDLDNQMQYLAMSRLKKRYEETSAKGFKRPDTPDGKTMAAADRHVQSYWPRAVAQIEKFKRGEVGVLPNPHAEYADIVRDEKQGFKANEEARKRETSEGQWERIRDFTNDLALLLANFDIAISSSKADPRIKAKATVVSRMRSQANELRAWAQKG